MTDQERKAMEMALERLVMWADDFPNTAVVEDHWAIEALRQALAQPKYRRGDRLLCLESEEYCVIHISGTDRQWVKFPDLQITVYTNEQVQELFELIPKETDEAIAQPEQEPVAWIRSGDDQLSLVKVEDDGYMVWKPLYTAPSISDYHEGWEEGFKASKALSQPSDSVEQEPVAWTQVSDALPKSGMTVLACYKNSLGNLRRIRAQWVAAKTEEASVDYGECYEYDEETDEYYLTEGWYECMDNWPEYSSVAVCEGEITHWMPLPPAPDEAYTAQPSKPWVSLTDEEFDNIYYRHNTYDSFARAIEAALKEKNT